MPIKVDNVGGGLDTTAGDARYLKLDCSNDPLTGNLDINGTLSMNAGQVINQVAQATFPGTIYYGDGVGASLSHTTGWTGYYNTYVGLGSTGNTTTTGYRNVSVGYQALYAVTTGYQNLSLGADTLYANTTGHNNVAMGYAALERNTSGHHNIGFGTNTLGHNTTGHYNMGVGELCLSQNTTGEFNVGIGYAANSNNTTGSNNVAIGRYALGGELGARSDNIAIGGWAGRYETGSDSLYIDNQDRGSEAAGKTDSLIYGVFNATVASQSLTINAGNVYLPHDNEKLFFGTGNDASIYYDGTDMVVNPAEAGSGKLKMTGGSTNGFGYIWMGTAGNYDGYMKFAIDPTGVNDWEMAIYSGGVNFANWISAPSYRTAITGIGDGSIMNWTNTGGTGNGRLDLGFQYNANVGIRNYIDGTEFFEVWEAATNDKLLQVASDGEVRIPTDNAKLLFGAGQDASIYYDGTDMYLNSQEVGSGHIVLNSPKTTTGDPAGVEGKIYWNTIDNVIKMYADGAWRTLASW